MVKFSTSIHSTKDILYYVHFDLWVESHVPSLGGAGYMLSIVDDYSRRVCLYFMKHKSNVFKTFKERKIMIEKQANKHI